MSENRLTFIKKINNRDNHGHKRGLYQCSCGNILEVNISSVNTNNTKSCGCLNLEKIKERNFKHGKNRTKKHRTWQNIKTRCLNKSRKYYKHYGGRGITICEKWLNFEGFDEDMPDPPGEEYQIERINNNGNYEKSNCKWATRKEESRNKRTNINITYNGKTQILADWAEEFNINPGVLRYRLKNGWDIEKALTFQVKIGNNQYNV